ncbi:hypothetical protein ACDV62_20135 [Proteus mirabilis]|uniref:hypothetical protein n=1 Tax=Proteus mirabilis TaxID=584 RepID=UPI003555FCBC
MTQRLGMGAGRAKRSAAATCTPATWRTDKAPWGAASVGVQRPKGGAGRSPKWGVQGGSMSQ